MLVNWRRWARRNGWRVEGDSLCVAVGSRQQSVHVLQSSEGNLLSSIVAKRSVIQRLANPDLHAWQRNRVSELVGFRIDKRGYLIAETALPEDANEEEWSYLVFNLARAADRFEYVLTGQDNE
jgi:hypothetical protein